MEGGPACWWRGGESVEVVINAILVLVSTVYAVVRVSTVYAVFLAGCLVLSPWRSWFWS